MKITSKKIMIVLGVLLFAAVITASAGCLGGGGHNNDIIGTWISDEKVLDYNTYEYYYLYYEFRKDHTGTEIWKDSKRTSYEFTWDDRGDGTYRITYDDYDDYEYFYLDGRTLEDDYDYTYHKT